MHHFFAFHFSSKSILFGPLGGVVRTRECDQIATLIIFTPPSARYARLENQVTLRVSIKSYWMDAKSPQLQLLSVRNITFLLMKMLLQHS